MCYVLFHNEMSIPNNNNKSKSPTNAEGAEFIKLLVLHLNRSNKKKTDKKRNAHYFILKTLLFFIS